MSLRNTTVLAALLVAQVFLTGQAWGQPDGKAKDKPHTTSEERIRAALRQPCELIYRIRPLVEVAEEISEKHKIPIVLNTKELETVGAGSDTTITRSVKGVSLRSGLSLLLKEHDLTWVIKDEVLMITSIDHASTEMTTRVYDVRDLVYPRKDEDADEDPVADFDSLIDLITSTVAPDSWAEAGGIGDIDGIEFGDKALLVFSQTDFVHQEVAELLAMLRNAPPVDQSEKTKIEANKQAETKNSKEELIRAALRQPCDLNYTKSPLSKVVEELSDQYKIPIVLDTKELETVGAGSDTTVTRHIKGISLQSGLNLLLREHDLTSIIKDEVLLITSIDAASTQMETRVHDVRDLVYRQREGAASRPLVYSHYEIYDTQADFDSLIVAIKSAISPGTWDDAGGTGAIDGYQYGNKALLVICNTQDVQQQIVELLKQLRDAPPASKPGETKQPTEQEKKKAATEVYARVYRINPKGASAEECLKLIREAFDPESWNEKEGRRVTAAAGTIVVRHNRKTHKRVQNLLSDINALIDPWSDMQREFGGNQPGAPVGGGFFQVAPQK